MKTYNHIYVLEDKVMKNNITEVVFILDRSGSMGGLESDTIGGFNSTLKKQKELDGKCLITTVLFDDQYEIIHDRVDAREAKEITEKEYFVRGCTALVDAIGKSISHIEKIHKYSRPEDIPEHTMFIITLCYISAFVNIIRIIYEFRISYKGLVYISYVSRKDDLYHNYRRYGECQQGVFRR